MQDGYSPLYVASQNGHTEVVNLLVQAGANVNLATSDEVHDSTHTVSSSIAAVVETNIKFIEFVVYDLHELLSRNMILYIIYMGVISEETSKQKSKKILKEGTL